MKHYISAVLLAALSISCVNEGITDVVPEKPRAEALPEGGTGAYVSGEVYVCFSDEMVELIENDLAAGRVQTKSSELNGAVEALGITELRRVFPHAGKFEPRTRREGLHKWYVVKYSDDMPCTKAADNFLSIGGVEYVEPVRNIAIKDFNDPKFGQLWGLSNTANPNFDINVKPVWDNYTTGNPNVIVSVVDEGVDYKHEDLAANCVEESLHFSAVPGKIVPGEHGTHVAGTIAAVSNNRLGVSGIAGGDKAKGQAGVRILSCQIFAGDAAAGSDGSALAIKEGADRGAVISQNSWGYIFDADGDGVLNPRELEEAKNTKAQEVHKAAIDYFIKYAGFDENGRQVGPMAGGVVIFAAGNDAIQYGAPAEYENVIAVGSIDSEGKRSDFSNYGDWVDIAAPGTRIYSTVPGGYDYSSGTSMACPHVSGVAALIVSHYGGPGFTNDMLKEALLKSANTEVIPKSYKIGGLLDAYGAMLYAKGKDVQVDPVVDLEAAGKLNTLTLSWTTPKDSEGDAAYGFMILYGTEKADVEAATADNHSKVKALTFIPGTAAGKKVNYIITNLDFDTKYYVKVISYSFGRAYAEPSSVREAQTGINNAPAIVMTDEAHELKASQTLNINVGVSDPDGHEVTVKYESGSAADSFKSLPGGSWQITIVGSAADEGTYTAKIIATDEYGLESVREVTYRILGNLAPVKLKEMENVMLPGDGKEFVIDMAEYVSDPDGDDLRYEIKISDPMVLHVVAKSGKLIGTSLAYGVSDVEVKAMDAKGAEAVFTFKVQVKNPAEPVSVYPNPVTDFVNIGTLDSAETRIRIVSQSGKTVYDETSSVSGYEPTTIDMKSCPPGIYVVTVAFGGNEYKQNIIKL